MPSSVPSRCSDRARRSRSPIFRPIFRLAAEDSAKPSSLDLPEEGLDLAALVAQIEKEMIDRALARTDNNKGAAARLLGLKRTTLVEKLKRF